MGHGPIATMRLNPFRYRTREEIEAKERIGPSFLSLVFRTKWKERNRRERFLVIYGVSIAFTAGFLVVPIDWGIDYLVALVF